MKIKQWLYHRGTWGEDPQLIGLENIESIRLKKLKLEDKTEIWSWEVLGIGSVVLLEAGNNDYRFNYKHNADYAMEVLCKGLRDGGVIVDLPREIEVVLPAVRSELWKLIYQYTSGNREVPPDNFRKAGIILEQLGRYGWMNEMYMEQDKIKKQTGRRV